MLTRHEREVIETLACPPHVKLIEKIEPVNQCVICLRNQRDELQQLLSWAIEFITEPEWFPNEGDRQWWQERYQSCLTERRTHVNQNSK